MTYKQIEASREMRLWIGQVIVPAAVAAVAIASKGSWETGTLFFYAKFTYSIVKRQLAQMEERSTGLKSRMNGMRMRRSSTTRTVSFIFLKGEIK